MSNYLLAFTLILAPVYTFCQEKMDSSYMQDLAVVTKLSYKDLNKASDMLDSIISIIENVDGFALQKATAFRQKAIIRKDKNLDSVEYYTLKSLEIARTENLEIQELYTLLNYGNYLKSVGSFDRADSIYQSLDKHPYYKTNEKEKVGYYLNFSSLNMKQQDTEKATKNLEKALEVSAKHDFHKYDLHIFHKLGGIYHALHDYSKSLEYSRRSLAVIDPEDLRKYSIHNNMASEFINLNELDSAKYHLDYVLRGNPKESSLIFTNQNLANIAFKQNEYKRSLEYSSDCVELASKLGSMSSVCFCNLYMARSYNAIEQYQKAQKLLVSLEDCIQKDHLVDQLALYEELKFGNELSLLGRDDLALKWKDIILKKDSIREGETASQLREVETKYRTQQKELDNLRLSHENELNRESLARQRYFVGALFLGIVGLLFGLYMLWKRNKEKSAHVEDLSRRNNNIESLNHEIVHRTKNYLALATALLSKHKVESRDEKVISALEENEHRMKVLTSINQKLTADNMTNIIKLKPYLDELVDDLIFSFAHIKGEEIDVHINVEDISVDSETSLYFGLITNELFINSMKHAKTHNSHLKIDIALILEEGTYRYSYNDNGQTGIAAKSEPSEGIGLISDLISQMKGRWNVSQEKGYSFHADIPFAA